jgi:hypothetical protein
MLADAISSHERAYEGRPNRDKDQKDRNIECDTSEKVPAILPILARVAGEYSRYNDKEWQADGGFFREQS